MDLYEHQISAIKDLQNGNILKGDVGSGKSRTAVTYYFCKVCGGKMPINGKGSYSLPKNPMDLYIITTAHKRDTREWEQECLPFLITENQDENPCKIKMVVDSWNNIGKYSTVENAFFIFDEQRVVGYGSWSKDFIKISKKNQWILLSATPGDTYADYIPVFIANGFFKNKTEFVRNHVVFSRYSKYPKIERYLQTDKLERYKRMITVDMEDRRTTTCHYNYILCGFDEELYSECQKNRMNPETQEPMRDVAELCRVLRKIVNTDESRFEQLYSLYDDRCHEKIIVFYNFNYELDLLRNFCQTHSIPYSEWNGQKHEPIPDYDKWIYLVQYTAGAEGWNCTLTDTMVFFSQSYSYKQTVQAAGRINRMNTPFSELYYYYFVSNSTIDKAIKRTLHKKKDFNEKAFADFIKPELRKTDPRKFQTL